MDLKEKAFQIAEKYHRGQTRRNGEPYLNHLIRVQRLLELIGADEIVQIAGILHDILEDTSYSVQEMGDDFGAVVLDLVTQVTKNEDGSFDILDQRAWLIKLADGFDNVTDTDGRKPGQIIKYAQKKRALFGLRDDVGE